MSRFPFATVLTGMAALLGLTVRTQAQVVYSDTFDNGASRGTASAYFSDTSQNNGLVVKTSIGIYALSTIVTDVSGTGYFLYNGTNLTNVPSNQTAAYISQSFAVAQNTNYNVSFFLVNDGNNNNAQIQAAVNGSALGPAVSAIGNYATNGWQKFNFTFNSGTATTETLTLSDLTPSVQGNDFGLDNISVAVVPAAVPEPGSVALLIGLGVTGAGFLARRRK